MAQAMLQATGLPALGSGMPTRRAFGQSAAQGLCPAFAGRLHSWNQEYETGSLRSVSLPRRAAVAQKVQRKCRSAGMGAVAILDIKSADKQKIDGMPFRRVVFDFPDWQKHRSSGRYLKHVTTITASRVIGSLAPVVAFMTGVAAGVVTWNELVIEKILPEWAPLLHMSSLPLSLTAPALSLLLVFRTNSSYGRFDEARKMWGLMLNRSRDITRQALSYIARGPFEYERPILMQFVRHMQAFPITYKHHFLREGDIEQELRSETTLTEDEIQGILIAKHRPNACLQMMSECMARVHMEPIHRYGMDVNLATFADDIGGCERLFKTPIPLSYTRLTSRFLVLWHLFLPFGLWDACGWVTIPATFMSAGALFCVEEVGVLIEEPFSILALNVIATSSRTNVGELVSLHDSMKARIVSVEEPASLPSSATSAASVSSSVSSAAAPSNGSTSANNFFSGIRIR